MSQLSGFPFELHRVPGARPLDELARLRAVADGIPVILGDAESCERMAMQLGGTERSAAELVEAALAIDVPDWLQQLEGGDPNRYAIEPAVWPEGVRPADALVAHTDVLHGRPLPEVLLAVIPVAAAWMVPCHLQFGGWNDCPPPEVHAALLRYWGGRHGAQLVSMAGDVVELMVSRPPTTREAALALAREQYLYCTDIVDQGVGSIEALAATLLGGSVWYFWWD
jgi:hypothetical protein